MFEDPLSGSIDQLSIKFIDNMVIGLLCNLLVACFRDMGPFLPEIAAESLAHILDQISHILNPHTEPDDSIADPARVPDLRRYAGMGHRRRMGA